VEGAPLDWAVQAPRTRIPSASGVSPLALENIIQLRLFLHDGHPWGWYYPVDGGARLNSPVLDLLNVRYLTASGEGAARLAANGRFRLAASLPGQDVFENRGALARFFLVHDARIAPSLREARAVIAGGIDFSKTAILDAALPFSPIGLRPVAAGNEAVRAISYQPDSMELEATADGAALLIVTDNEYPGWHAWVDGRETPIHAADIAFRALAIPSGTHRIRMEFRPVILYWSLSVTVATGIVLLVLGWFGIGGRWGIG
jgi:hypothetical protein